MRRRTLKSRARRPARIGKADFDDPLFSRLDVSAPKAKATVLDAILNEIWHRGYTQNQLVEILDEYQPSVSNLLRGKVAGVSLEKLLKYCDRLRLTTTVTVRPRAFGPKAWSVPRGFAYPSVPPR